MSILNVVNRAGKKTAVDAEDGLTVMEIIRNNGFDELIAQCGGACSCATCHVHVAEDFFDKLPPMSEDEDVLLDSSDCRDAFSRLSCQIKMSGDLDGLEVRIAENF